MTNNYKLQEILKNEPKFKGVYDYDKLATLPLYNDGVFVVNYITRKEALNGAVGHYVVVDLRKHIVKGDGTVRAYYFDPYGLSKPDEARDILGLPNLGLLTQYLSRIPGGYDANTKDFQAEKPWDSLCGVYSALYIKNPNFHTNPIFMPGTNRVKLDHKLQTLFNHLDVLGKTRFYYDKIETNRNINLLTTL